MYPAKLKSGYMGENVFNIGKRKLDYVSLIDSVVDIDSMDLKTIYECLYDFYLEFSTSIHSLPRIDDSLPSILKIQRLIEHYSKLSIGALFQFDEEVDILDPIQLKYNVIMQWIRKSQFDTLKDFQKFENLYIIVSSPNFKNLKYSIFTQNPNLLFPKFYKLVRQVVEFSLDTYRAECIVEASNRNSVHRLMTTRPVYDSGAAKFFQHYFCFIIANGSCRNKGENKCNEYEADELNANYRDKFSQFSQQLNSFINVNCICLMYRALTGTNISRHQLAQASESIDHVANKRFVSYYKSHSESIICVLREKWIAAMSKKGEKDMLNEIAKLFANCLYCLQDVQILSKEISNFTLFLYVVYQPILNWIYGDLGAQVGA